MKKNIYALINIKNFGKLIKYVNEKVNEEAPYERGHHITKETLALIFIQASFLVYIIIHIHIYYYIIIQHGTIFYWSIPLRIIWIHILCARTHPHMH